MRTFRSEQIREVIGDDSIEVSLGQRNTRPAGQASINTTAFSAIEQNLQEHYGVITLPTMSTGATDMAYLRARGVQCLGLVQQSIVKMLPWVLELTAIRNAY